MCVCERKFRMKKTRDTCATGPLSGGVHRAGSKHSLSLSFGTGHLGACYGPRARRWNCETGSTGSVDDLGSRCTRRTGSLVCGAYQTSWPRAARVGIEWNRFTLANLTLITCAAALQLKQKKKQVSWGEIENQINKNLVFSNHQLFHTR